MEIVSPDVLFLDVLLLIKIFFNCLKYIEVYIATRLKVDSDRTFYLFVIDPSQKRHRVSRVQSSEVWELYEAG